MTPLENECEELRKRCENLQNCINDQNDKISILLIFMAELQETSRLQNEQILTYRKAIAVFRTICDMSIGSKLTFETLTQMIETASHLDPPHGDKL